jgi:hypothetical protein
VKRIREIAVQHYPLLEKWGTDGFGWGDLMFIESEAMLGAIRTLMWDGIPSLSVHDSLIIPVSQRELAQAVLEDHYQQLTGACPVLKVHHPLASEEGSDLAFTDTDLDQQNDDPYGFGVGDEVTETAEAWKEAEDEADHHHRSASNHDDDYNEYPSSEYL